MSHNEDRTISSPYLRGTKLLPGIEPPVEEHSLEYWTVTLSEFTLRDHELNWKPGGSVGAFNGTQRAPIEEYEEPDPNYGDPRTFLFKKGDRCVLCNLQDEDNQKFNDMEVVIDIQRQCPKTSNNPSGHAYYLVHNPMSGHFVYEERLRLV